MATRVLSREGSVDKVEGRRGHDEGVLYYDTVNSVHFGNALPKAGEKFSFVR